MNNLVEYNFVDFLNFRCENNQILFRQINVS